jgi:hypothetical protein
MLVVIMSTIFSEFMLQTVDTLTLWEAAFLVFVLFPLVIGWVQRWFWTRGVADDDPEVF